MTPLVYAVPVAIAAWALLRGKKKSSAAGSGKALEPIPGLASSPSVTWMYDIQGNASDSTPAALAATVTGDAGRAQELFTSNPGKATKQIGGTPVQYQYSSPKIPEYDYQVFDTHTVDHWRDPAGRMWDFDKVIFLPAAPTMTYVYQLKGGDATVDLVTDHGAVWYKYKYRQLVGAETVVVEQDHGPTWARDDGYWKKVETDTYVKIDTKVTNQMVHRYQYKSVRPSSVGTEFRLYATNEHNLWKDPATGRTWTYVKAVGGAQTSTVFASWSKGEGVVLPVAWNDYVDQLGKFSPGKPLPADTRSPPYVCPPEVCANPRADS